MRSPDLPEAFLRAPIAHRGLHDRGRGVVENSRASVQAAVLAGYGIEIDVQRSGDGVAMVFHDATLKRLTGLAGRVDAHESAALGAIALRDSSETIPTLREILTLIAGRAPLLVELKDPDDALADTDGALEADVAASLEDYDGPVALMSFNPHVVAHLAKLAPDRPRGLTTCDFVGPSWPLPDYRRAELAGMADYNRVGATFVSHNHRELDNPALADLRARCAPILCWTVRSLREETAARARADNVTFEGYRPRPIGP